MKDKISFLKILQKNDRQRDASGNRDHDSGAPQAARGSEATNRSIADEAGQDGLLIAAISVWKVAVKVSVGKLALP